MQHCPCELYAADAPEKHYRSRDAPCTRARYALEYAPSHATGETEGK